jgi:hypothetical protein
MAGIPCNRECNRRGKLRMPLSSKAKARWPEREGSGAELRWRQVGEAQIDDGEARISVGGA